MNETYDYIIVGGGTAGCVLANRLSADGKNQVCLIEAGPILKNLISKMPVSLLITNKLVNWRYWTIEQLHCNQRPMYYPTGKILGGTSAINGTLYIRGNSADYDHWETLGNKGWSYQDILPYFKKLEDYELGEDAYHGIGGPVHVKQLTRVNTLTKAFLQAAEEAGLIINADFNGKKQEGVGLFPVTVKKGRRMSSSYAYLLDGKKRTNLTIISNAQVTKININDKRAVGVRVISGNNKPLDIAATKEIIISAGAINSPKILLLSGIGPHQELEKHHIPVVHELKGVGKNFHDHLDTPLIMLEKTRLSISVKPRALLRNLLHFGRYVLFKSGDFSRAFCESGAFIKSTTSESIPDLQWHFTPMMYANPNNMSLVKKYYGFHIMTSFLHPYSRGEVTLQNANPQSAPSINPNYLADERDITPLLTGIRKAREVLAQHAFDDYRLKEFLPGEDIQSDEQIINYIKTTSEPGYHGVGTCKMGTDELAVVDSRLKVHGISGLRVIDASIMPVIVSGNTNAPTTMIAEKGADMILQDHS